ncbi:Ser/Thr phosphatase family superfamily protein [Pelomyxa schiedti]|nr:Ser/Thr phosphatase family superfamily protein [Pelomyxa schiedti]
MFRNHFLRDDGVHPHQPLTMFVALLGLSVVLAPFTITQQGSLHERLEGGKKEQRTGSTVGSLRRSRDYEAGEGAADGGGSGDQAGPTVDPREVLSAARRGASSLRALLAANLEELHDAGRAPRSAAPPGGLDINCTDEGQNTPLHICVENKDLEAVQLLLQFPEINLNATNAHLKTALSLAIEKGHSKIAALLIDHGAPTFILDGDGQTPLDVALLNGDTDCISLLIERSDPNTFTWRSPNSELNPIKQCIIHNLPHFIEPLIEKGVSANTTSKSGETAMHLACNLSDEKVISIIFKHCAVNVTTVEGQTPLHLVALSNRFDFAQRLIKKGAIIQSRNVNGDTPLHYCCSHGNVEFAKLLVAQGAQVETQNVRGETALTMAKRIGSQELVTFLEGIPNPIRSRTFSLQCASDIHLEFGSNPTLTPRAPYLALLGDTTVLANEESRLLLSQFLRAQTRAFKKVFIVMGNHEFYKSAVKDAKLAMQQICAAEGAVFLDKTCVEIEGVRILGATLWSFIPEEARIGVNLALTDYRAIDFNESRKISIEDTNQWHVEETRFLKEEIARASKDSKRVVVLTHHAPVIDLCSTDASQYNTPRNHAFCTDLRAMLGPPVAAWFYGHTHWFQDQVINGTRIINNPHGYPKESLPFNSEFVVDISL